MNGLGQISSVYCRRCERRTGGVHPEDQGQRLWLRTMQSDRLHPANIGLFPAWRQAQEGCTWKCTAMLSPGIAFVVVDDDHDDGDDVNGW